MAAKTVKLVRHFGKGIGVVQGGDAVFVMVDLWPWARSFTPKGGRFIHKLLLPADDARKLAIDLMAEAQKAADYERSKKSP